MAIRNLEYYEKARIDSELEFIHILNENKFINVFDETGLLKSLNVISAYQGDEFQDKSHIDVVVECEDDVLVHIDVKDQMTHNRGSTRFSVSNHEFKDMQSNYEKYDFHLLALRQYVVDHKSNEYKFVPSGKYFIIPTQIALQRNSNWFFRNPDQNIDSWLIDPVLLYRQTKLCYQYVCK